VLVRKSSNFKIVSLILVILVFTGIRQVFISKNIPHPAIWVLPVTHFESIILGIVVGFGGFDTFLKRVKPLILAFISILFFALVCILPEIEFVSGWLHISYISVGIFTSLALFSVLKSNILKAIFSIKVFVFLGKRSYGLYVYHLLGNGFATFIVKKISIIPSGSLAVFLYALAFTIGVSVISYNVIEKPFLKLKKRFEVIISRPI